MLRKIPHEHGMNSQSHRKRMLARILRPTTRALHPLRRLSTSKEQLLEQQLRTALQATHVVVKDISGGCGAMFHLEVESPLFKGVPLIKQHRMVKEVCVFTLLFAGNAHPWCDGIFSDN